ncbi:MAG TPA: ribosome silencing factor [Acidimicrobiales bacterium]|jgi:ribosome-associated protein
MTSGAGDGEREEARRLAVVAARAADAKGAEDIVILEVAGVLNVVDEFVIASAANDRQVRAVIDEVERQVVDAGLAKPLRVEGRDERKWVLLDYGDVVVHVFLREVREYYELERLWSDVPRIEWASELTRR